MVQPPHSSIPKPVLGINKIYSRPFTFILLICLCILGYLVSHYPQQAKTIPSTLHFHDTFLSLASNYTVSQYLRSLTLHPHLAGTDAARKTAEFVQTHFEQLRLETRVAEYRVLLSYPVHTSLSAHFSDGSTTEFQLHELGRGSGDVVRPYHAYSPSGSAEAKAVFVNYGREEDYRALGLLGLNASGCIVIARRGEMSRHDLIKMAEEKGAVAVLMYTEGGVFADGVERGTVMKGIGDPLSPGWASVEYGERLAREDSEVMRRFPGIPSMPISAKIAEAILTSLEGPKMPQEWTNALKTKGGRIGPGPTLLNFTFKGEEKMASIRDIFAVIRGFEEPDRYVLLGNHRDAWTYGAVDPNSGTSALLDIGRRFAFLMRLGWRPRRSIVLCSWDAEEFGMIGSTEWVEQNLFILGSKAIAYLNVDCAVQGAGLFARSTPQLDDLIVEVTKKVKDPDVDGTTVYEQWIAANKGIDIQRLSGVDSDYASFLQYAGVPSVDLYYGKDFPVYHTAFDSYDWMINSGDPFFHRHVAVVGLWGLVALRLADDPVLPFNYPSYAAQLQKYTNVLSNLLENNESLHPITTSIRLFSVAAIEVEEERKKLQTLEAPSELLVLKRRMLNDRLMLAERGLLDMDGLKSTKWFKHLVYGPSAAYNSKLEVFPGIADATSQYSEIEERDGQQLVQHEIWRVARAIERAAHALSAELV